MTDKILEKGKEILKQEASALLQLADELTPSFTAAVEKLKSVKEGRVVVSGIGKSGHIAHKISATLSSTGCPSFFVHPTEASHGDLGALTKADVLIAISNSGETPELQNMLEFCKQHAITIIAITSQKNSSLAHIADIVLLLANRGEAGSLALAPTTSTTQTLALGDALALALLESKGFTNDDFHRLHPGGQLGKKLLKVKDIMHQGQELPLVEFDIKMQQAIIAMASMRFGVIGVKTQHGELAGIITDGDLRRALDQYQQFENFFMMPVQQIMNPNPMVTTATAFAAEILAVMTEKQFQVMFVVKEIAQSKTIRYDLLNSVKHKQVVGIVHIHDILRAL